MLEFLRKYRHVLTGLLLLLVTLQIPIYRQQDRSLGFAAKVFYTLAYYPQNGWALLTEGVTDVLEHYVFLVHVASENERLNAENARLRSRLFELREAASENERLRHLLQMRQRNDYEAIGSRVIALDASNWFRSFTINAGSSDGLETGMPVVTDEGLVGTVISVALLSSKVLPVVDLNSSIPVVSQRTRARGMIVGRGSRPPKLSFLERAEDVRVGDLLVTSGLGGAFPAGVPVAKVRSVTKKSYGLFQEAEVDTIVRFGRVENVAVLRYRAQDTIPSFVPPATEASSPATAETNLVDADEEEAPAKKVVPAKPKPKPRVVKPQPRLAAEEAEEDTPSLGDRSLPVIPAAMPRIPKPAARTETESRAEPERVVEPPKPEPTRRGATAATTSTQKPRPRSAPRRAPQSSSDSVRSQPAEVAEDNAASPGTPQRSAPNADDARRQPREAPQRVTGGTR